MLYECNGDEEFVADVLRASLEEDSEEDVEEDDDEEELIQLI
jgi:hypothetical protein